MILIISNSAEPTTDMVIDWLISKGANFARINSEDITQLEIGNSLQVGNNNVHIAGTSFNLDEINVVWYRRWYAYSNMQIPGGIPHRQQLIYELREEATEIGYYLFLLLSGKIWLSDPFITKKHNKLFALKIAAECGLPIPQTLVTNCREELCKFYSPDAEEIITKPVGDPYVYTDTDGKMYKPFTNVINKESLQQIGDYFFTSLFQKRVQAAHEIRVFYLDGYFYATAIMHAETVDIKLSVGFLGDKINMIPYQLPRETEEKLRLFMQRMHLNSGSIDIIKDHQGNHVFLEVNPIGQFMGYSLPANHGLAEKVANWLIKKDNHDT